MPTAVSFLSPGPCATPPEPDCKRDDGEAEESDAETSRPRKAFLTESAKGIAVVLAVGEPKVQAEGLLTDLRTPSASPVLDVKIEGRQKESVDKKEAASSVPANIHELKKQADKSLMVVPVDGGLVDSTERSRCP